jgi:hypothetical protein
MVLNVKRVEEEKRIPVDTVTKKDTVAYVHCHKKKNQKKK